MKTTETFLASWKLGITEFNEGRYWQAHVYWEKDWLLLESPQKEYIQALIQACGVFYLLLEKSRPSGAFSLCQLALNRLTALSHWRSVTSVPHVEIPNLETTLLAIKQQLVSRNRASNDKMDTTWVRPMLIPLKATLVNNPESTER